MSFADLTDAPSVTSFAVSRTTTRVATGSLWAGEAHGLDGRLALDAGHLEQDPAGA